MPPSGQQPEFVILRLQVVFWGLLDVTGFAVQWEGMGKMVLGIWRRGERRVGKKVKERKTYGRAAKPATAGFAGHTERVAAAGGADRHAKGSQVGGGRHAALYCFSFMSAIHSIRSTPDPEKWNSPSGLKHSQLMSLAPRSFALLG